MALGICIAEIGHGLRVGDNSKISGVFLADSKSINRQSPLAPENRKKQQQFSDKSNASGSACTAVIPTNIIENYAMQHTTVRLIQFRISDESQLKFDSKRPFAPQHHHCERTRANREAKTISPSPCNVRLFLVSIRFDVSTSVFSLLCCGYKISVINIRKFSAFATGKVLIVCVLWFVLPYAEALVAD